ncbi:MAG: hypothetical protein LBQ35_00815 [Spirochaetaceae bacterium]|jgi:hypothetical protein|nr:hypothetical protein [Spirochaetaceae bacterium]
MGAAKRFGNPGKGLFFLPLALLLLGSCATVVEKAGGILDGSAFREKTLEIWRSPQGGRGGQGGRGLEIRRVLRKKDGKEFLLIRPAAFPTLVLRASPSRTERDGFTLESLEFLSPNRDGWNSFRRDLRGGGVFRSDGYSAFFALQPGTDVLDLSAGGIRRGAARLYGDEALRALRSRDERITALVLWMGEYLAGAALAGTALAETAGSETAGGGHFSSGEAFERYWRPILFPELVRRELRPALWAETEGENRAEGVTWNTGYSRALLPEALRPLRDSGALLRDWEEALEWVYYQFEWPYILHSLTGASHAAGGGLRLIKDKP